jgi:hypothetical protein
MQQSISVYSDENFVPSEPDDAYNEAGRKFMAYYNDHKPPMGHPPNIVWLHKTLSNFDSRSSTDRLSAMIAATRDEEKNLQPQEEIVEGYTKTDSKISHSVPKEHITSSLGL